MMEKREEEISQVLNAWEPIPSQQPSFQAHSSSLRQQQQQQQQAQTREWEMVEHHRNEDEDEDDDDDDDDDFSIFPPSNHEGLHIPSHQQQQVHHVADVEHYSSPLPQPQSNINQEQPLDSLIDAKKMLMKNLRLGVEVISSNIFRVVSLCHYYARRRMGNWSLSSVYVGGFSFTMALLMSFWFFKWQRWRRRESREEKIDQLFQLVRHQDEKMNQLLDQISYLNELLARRRRIPILRSD